MRIALITILFTILILPNIFAEASSDSERAASIVGNMKKAYAHIDDYRMETEVREYREGKLIESKLFLYTFKKPNHIRIDMKSEYPGMILIYPDENGKVFVKPGGIAGLLKRRLSPDSSLLKSSAGQRIDQTDLGLLIRNISRSVTDQRRGRIKVSGSGARVILEVLAENHFLAGLLTLYEFHIEKKRWLPSKVREFTPDGVLTREVIFRNLKTSIGVPESLFKIDGGT